MEQDFKRQQIRYISFISFTISILLSFTTNGQGEEDNQSTTSLLMAAKEIMISSGTCALITLDNDDRPMIRTMDPFYPEEDFTVWFGTNPKSRKVNQIQNNPNVTLYYWDTNGGGYVTIRGRAKIIDDQQEKDNRWKEEWDAFYHDKINNYLLIKVTPIWLEIISESRGILGDTLTWTPPRINLSPK